MYILSIFVKNKLVVNSRDYFSALNSVPLVYVSFYTQMTLFGVTKGLWYMSFEIKNFDSFSFCSFHSVALDIFCASM